MADASAAPGEVRLDRFEIMGQPLDTTIQGEIRRQGALWEIRSLDGRFAGGSVSGVAQLETGTPGVPFLAELHADDLAVNELMAVACAADIGLDRGTLCAVVKMTGYARYPKTLRGVGRITLPGLAVPIAKWWSQVESPGTRSAPPPVSVIAVRDALADFYFLGGQLVISDASLFSDDLILRGLGIANAHTGISLSCRVYLPPGAHDWLSARMASWPPDRRIELMPLPNSPWFFRDFLLTGSANDPRIVVWNSEWPLPAIKTELKRLCQLATGTVR
jgi:hypothetical protein